MSMTAFIRDPFASMSRCDSRDKSTSSPIGGIVLLLRELSTVMEGLNDEQYACKQEAVFGGSIGGHVRHSLDHVQSIIDAMQTGRLDYDHRLRGTKVESDRWVALDVIRRLIGQLTGAQHDTADCELTLRSIVSAEKDLVEVSTTLSRELIYVLSHTVHHNAMIAAMTRTLGGWVPQRFGFAPSTLAHLKESPCAR